MAIVFHIKYDKLVACSALFFQMQILAEYQPDSMRKIKAIDRQGVNFMQNQNSMIQSKSLTILGDQLQHEYVACRKSEFYASSFTDPQLKAVAQQLASDHKQRFNRLFNYLSTHA